MGQSAPCQVSGDTASKVNKTLHCFSTHLGHSFAFRCVAILTAKFTCRIAVTLAGEERL